MQRPPFDCNVRYTKQPHRDSRAPPIRVAPWTHIVLRKEIVLSAHGRVRRSFERSRCYSRGYITSLTMNSLYSTKKAVHKITINKIAPWLFMAYTIVGDTQHLSLGLGCGTDRLHTPRFASSLSRLCTGSHLRGCEKAKVYAQVADG